MNFLSLPNSISLAWCSLDGERGHDAGRRLLAELYRQRTGGPLPPIAIADRGKPYFVDAPLHFSITHTKRHAFCALSDTPIGIDAEELSRIPSPSLVKKCLSPAEQARYDAAEDKNRAFLTLWVLKEAAAKLTGMGLTGYPKHTDFSLADPRVITIDGCLLAVLQEEHHAL